MAQYLKHILVLAPHCDDEVLGCGGVIARHASAGELVHIAIMTNGHLGAPELFSASGTEKVRSEALEAHGILGVSDTHFLDFPAPRLDTVPAYKLALKLSELIQRVSPETIYIPHIKIRLNRPLKYSIVLNQKLYLKPLT